MNAKMPEINLRVKTLVDSYSAGKVSDFVSKIGVSHQRLNRCFNIDPRNGKYPEPTKEVLMAILSAYPELNQAWLLTGKGDMLLTTEELPVPEDVKRNIPFYDVDAAAGVSYDMDMSPSRPIGTIDVGDMLRDSEAAMRVYGNSMIPGYPAGCVIGLKRSRESFIEPGTVYVIETDSNRYIKRLYYSDDRTAFVCHSDNHRIHESGPRAGKFYYPEFEIPLGEVKKVFLVVGVIKRNSNGIILEK